MRGEETVVKSLVGVTEPGRLVRTRMLHTAVSMPRALQPSLGSVTAGSMLPLALNGAIVILTSRLMSASSRGTYVALTTWVIFAVGLTHCSLGVAFARAVAKGSPVRQLLRTAMVQLLLLSMVAVGVLCIASCTSAAALNGTLVELGIACIAVPFVMLCDWVCYFAIGLERLRLFVVARGTLPATNLALVIVLLAVHHLDASTAIAAFTVGAIVTGVASLGLLWWPKEPDGLEVPPVRSLYLYGLKAHIGSISNMANLRLDAVFVSLFLASSYVSQYSLATSVSIPISAVGIAGGALVFKRIASGDSEGREVRALVLRTLYWSLGLMFVVAGAMMLIPVLFGESYRQAVGPGIVLAVGTPGLSVLFVGANILQARGQAHIASVYFGAAAILALITLLLLVPVNGIMGAAISSTVTYLVVGALMLIRLLRPHAAHAESPTSSGQGVVGPARSATQGSGT